MENPVPNPAPEWLPVPSWDELCRLSELTPFNDLKEHIRDNIAEWQKFYDSKSPQTTPLPAPWNTQLDDFRALIVLRCIRPDKVCSILS